jgi:RNA polymerase sigma-70 factor (ECF subfamily)
MPLDEYTDLADDALLALYSQGDTAAARTLTTRLTPRVFGHAVRVLGDWAEAEDVAQDAMMRLWKVAPDWCMGEAKVSTWLYRVTVNLCTDRLRRKRGVGLDEVDEPLDPSPSVTDQLQSRERMDALQAGLQTLPERQRQAVILRHIEGLGNPEIAKILEISTEAVESLTARGKRALAQALAPAREKLGYEDDSI